MKRFDDYCAKCDQYHDYKLDCTIITGQAPNIPWRKLQNMSDEEIKAENQKHYRIVGIEKVCDVNVYEKEIWNAAIDECLKHCDINAAEKIRSLKK